MFFGFKTLNIDQEGYPVYYLTPWKASCFILFTHVIYIGKILPDVNWMIEKYGK